MDHNYYIYIILALTGFTAGFINGSVGGGGLIALPILLSMGVPPHVAIAINKIQNIPGSLTSGFNFYKKGYIQFSKIIYACIFTVIGTIIGVVTMLNTDPDDLKHISIVILYIIFFITIFKKDKKNDINNKPIISIKLFFIIAGLVLGFYVGFFGPGGGLFWTMLMIIIIKEEAKFAIGSTKVFMCLSNLVALPILIPTLHINWIYCLVMGAGQVCGSYIGSSIIMKINDKIIKILFLVLIFVVLLKVTYNFYFAN